MVWVYNSPLTSREQKVYKVLKRKLKEEDIAKMTVKILSLYAFLKSQKFSSAKQIRESAFLDKQKTIAVFTEEQSKAVFKSLKKKGGASKYGFTNHLAKEGIDYATTLVPDSVKGTFQSVYDLVTSPVRIFEENVPFGDLVLGALHGATETGVTVAGDVAEGAGGPVGAAAVAPLTAMAAGLASLISMSQKEKDFGQAVAHLANAIPIIGSAAGKGITIMEDQVVNLKKRPEVAGYIPFVGEYITGQPRKPISLDAIKETVMAELQKRGLPTSPEELTAKAQSRLVAEAQKRGLPTSPEELTAKARERGLAEIQKRVPGQLQTYASNIQDKLQNNNVSEDENPTQVMPGGKRFSTQRRKYGKWPKTRRNKSAKV